VTWLEPVASSSGGDSRPTRSVAVKAKPKARRTTRKSKPVHYRGKHYTTAQARAGFAGPANKKRYQ